MGAVGHVRAVPSRVRVDPGVLPHRSSTDPGRGDRHVRFLAGSGVPHRESFGAAGNVGRRLPVLHHVAPFEFDCVGNFAGV